MMPAPKQPQSTSRRLLAEAQGVARFGLVGFLSTTIYYIAAVGIEWGGVGPQPANLFAYILSTSISFLGHFYYTFEKKGAKLPYLVRFIPVSVLGYVISRLIVSVGSGSLALPFWITAFAVVLAVAAFTWVVSRFWAFK